MHGIKSFQLGLNLYKVGMNSFHPFPTHCLVLIKKSLELLLVHLYKKFFLEQVAFIIFDFWRNFWSSTQQNYNLSRNGFIPEWNQFIPTRNQIIPTMNEFMGVQVFPYCLLKLNAKISTFLLDSSLSIHASSFGSVEFSGWCRPGWYTMRSSDWTFSLYSMTFSATSQFSSFTLLG